MSAKQQLVMDEALLLHHPGDRGGHGPSLLTIVGFSFLAFNSAMAVYWSNRDLGAISFVIFALVVLVILIYCLRLYEMAAPESARRENIKMAVWLLTTMLSFALWAILEYGFVMAERGPGSLLKDLLKAAVWILTTALTLLFSYKVADIVPAAVAVVVWVIALGTVTGGFYAFFIY